MGVSSVSRSSRLVSIELELGRGASAVRPERALNLVALCTTRSSGSRRSINNAAPVGRTLPLFKPPAAPIFFFSVGSAAAMRFAAVTAATALVSVGTWAVGLSSPRCWARRAEMSRSAVTPPPSYGSFCCFCRAKSTPHTEISSACVPSLVVWSERRETATRGGGGALNTHRNASGRLGEWAGWARRGPQWARRSRRLHRRRPGGVVAGARPRGTLAGRAATRFFGQHAAGRAAGVRRVAL
jgi:hypothetical protein